MTSFKIRNAKPKDLEQIFKVEKRSYPPELQAPHKVLADRLNTFGIRVAELPGNKIAGFYTSVPVFLDWNNRVERIAQILEHRHPHYTKWFEEYEQEKEKESFNTLYVTSTAVSSEHQGKGIGKALILDSLDLAKKHDLKFRASVLRMPGYLAYWKDDSMLAETYIEEVKDREIHNPFLEMYLQLGFTLKNDDVLGCYENDRTSNDCGVFAFKKIENRGKTK